MINLKDKLLEKSMEAFIMGIEIYNKPTIKYRIEGFSFFIINAWELMLKAKFLNENKSIYYKNEPQRTYSISKLVSLVYPDKYTKIRLNLEKIIDLRNISTHYITEDYELKYAPLFQACVLNFCDEILRYHNIDISTIIPQNFLTISANRTELNNEDIRLKYPPEIAEKLISQANELDVLSEEYDSNKFAIKVEHNFFITKSKEKANFTIKIDKNSKTKANIIKELKDPSNTHKYSFNNIVTVVNERLKKNKIKIGYDKGFNAYVLNLIIKFYNIKQNEKYAYKHTIGETEQYTYSQQFVEFIVNEIKKDPTKYVESLKK